MDTFDGTMTLDDGEQVAVELTLDTESLTLRTDGNLIGAWPVKYCRVSRSGRGAFLLSIDGEKVVFEPSQLDAFAMTAAQRFRASTLADRIGVVRDIASPDAPGGSRSRALADRTGSEPERRRWLPAALPGGVIPTVTALAVVLVTVFAVQRAGDDEVPAFVGTTLTIPETLPTAPPLFELTVEEFTTEWNLAATTFGVPVQIRGVLVPGQFESQLTPFVTLQGRTAEDRTVSSLVIVIDPSGDTEEDQRALGALGVAMRVASPELDRDGRAEVLEQMGLSVRDPDLTDLDGAAEVDDVSYSITFIPEFNSLLFTVNER